MAAVTVEGLVGPPRDGVASGAMPTVRRPPHALVCAAANRAVRIKAGRTQADRSNARLMSRCRCRVLCHGATLIDLETEAMSALHSWRCSRWLAQG